MKRRQWARCLRHLEPVVTGDPTWVARRGRRQAAHCAKKALQRKPTRILPEKKKEDWPRHARTCSQWPTIPVHLPRLYAPCPVPSTSSAPRMVKCWPCSASGPPRGRSHHGTSWSVPIAADAICLSSSTTQGSGRNQTSCIPSRRSSDVCSLDDWERRYALRPVLLELFWRKPLIRGRLLPRSPLDQGRQDTSRSKAKNEYARRSRMLKLRRRNWMKALRPGQ